MSQSNLEDLRNDLSEFSDRKFGKNRSFKSPINHLMGEAQETIDSDGSMYEFADMLLCILDGWRLKYPNVHTNTLILKAQEKLAIMEPRDFGKPDKDGNFQHTIDFTKPPLHIIKIRFAHNANEDKNLLFATKYTRNELPDILLKQIKNKYGIIKDIFSDFSDIYITGKDKIIVL